MLARLLYRPWFAREARGASDVDLFARMLGCAGLIAGGGLAAVWVFGDAALSLALAADYRVGAHELMGWIVAGYGLLVLAGPFEMRAYARKATSVIGIGWALAALANLGLNIAFIPLWGAVGAAQATLGSCAVYLAWVLWGTVLARRHDVTTAMTSR
jgi:O-antigen/teichoic acid export membrane protein